MENKNVGWLIIALSLIIVLIILLFNRAMIKIVTEGCPAIEHGESCPAYGTIQEQTYLSLSIVAILVAVGLFLVFSKQKERVIVKTIKEKKLKTNIDISTLTQEEKKVLSIIQENKALFQADLSEKTGLAKVRITRILDKLESKGIIERKRRGMQNLVVLSNS